MVESKQITTTSFGLTEEAQGIAASGSHEYRVWRAVPEKGVGEPLTVPELKVDSMSPTHENGLTCAEAIAG